jgi:predicted transcriptional regulator
VPHSFPPVGALEFGTSPILVPLLYGLKNHVIVGSALSGGRFLIVNLIEQLYLLVAGTPTLQKTTKSMRVKTLIDILIKDFLYNLKTRRGN